jgi:hypothetical protein
MKSVDLSAESIGLEQILDLAVGDNVIVRAANGREFVVAELDDFGREIGLVCQNSELMALLAARSGEERKLSHDEVKRSLGFTE